MGVLVLPARRLARDVQGQFAPAISPGVVVGKFGPDSLSWTMLRDSLFLLIFVLLTVVWLVSKLALHVASGLIHVILVVAVLSLIFHFLRGRRA